MCSTKFHAAWGDWDEVLAAASQLVDTGAARVNEIAAAFGLNTESLRRWRKSLEGTGLMGLAPVKKGPKRPSLLTESKAAQIRADGASLRATAKATGVSTDTLQRAMATTTETPAADTAHDSAAPLEAAGQPALPVLPAPVARNGARTAERASLLECAAPSRFPAARIRHAGLFLAFPAPVETTGMLSSAKAVYSALANGFYGPETILVD